MMFDMDRRKSRASLRRRLSPELRRGEAGFSMLEAFIALVILGVVGFAVYSGVVNGIRHVQAGREQAEQARRLEYAIDWARANACYVADQLATGSDLQLPLSGSEPAVIRTAPKDPDEPPAMLAIELTVPGGERVSGFTHVVVLDLGVCP